jgi:hypothetical protein
MTAVTVAVATAEGMAAVAVATAEGMAEVDSVAVPEHSPGAVAAMVVEEWAVAATAVAGVE